MRVDKRGSILARIDHSTSEVIQEITVSPTAFCCFVLRHCQCLGFKFDTTIQGIVEATRIIMVWIFMTGLTVFQLTRSLLVIYLPIQ